MNGFLQADMYISAAPRLSPGPCLRPTESRAGTLGIPQTGDHRPGPGCTALHQVLLPEGYPSSVSKDYLEYQLWDTLQVLSVQPS